MPHYINITDRMATAPPPPPSTPNCPFNVTAITVPKTQDVRECVLLPYGSNAAYDTV
jgi:hypothetical protein